MVNEGIVNKIKAMLNMTTENGCTEAEAQLALERAQALLLAHNLTMASVQDTETPGTPAGIGCLDLTEKQGYTWKRYLMSTLARANLCRIVVSPSKNQLHLFGRYDNVKAVMEMYTWMTFELPRLGIDALKEYQGKGGTEHGRTFNSGFYAGAISAIAERLRKPMETFSAGTGHDLVIYNTQAIKEAQARVFGHLVKSSSRISGGYAGQSAGRAAGSSMHLTPQRRLSGALRLNAGY